MKQRIFAVSVLVVVSIDYSYGAGNTNARDFYTLPSGASFTAVYSDATVSKNYYSDYPDGDESLNVNSLLFRQVWWTEACGMLCTPQILIPYADIAIRETSSDEKKESSGVGDPMVGATLFLINKPEEERYSGLLSLFTLPLGEYDGQSPATSPGANRWVANFVYNNTFGFGNGWVFEANLETSFYGDNNDFFGAALSESNTYSAQLISSYSLSETLYLAGGLLYVSEGGFEVGGVKVKGSDRSYYRAGFEVGYALNKENHIMFSYKEDVEVDDGYSNRYAGLRFLHFW